MLRYIWLNLVFLIPVFIFSYSNFRKNRLVTLCLLAVLTLLTAIFDNLIILSGIVAYEGSHLLGLYIGSAPIEDFAYTIAAAMLLPALWERRKHA